MERIKRYILYLTAFLCTTTYGAITFDHTFHDNTLHINVHYNLDKDDALFHNSLNFSIDNPAITLKSWKSSHEPVALYDSTFKTEKQSYQNSGTFQTLFDVNKDVDKATLYFHYQTKQSHEPHESSYSFSLKNPIKLNKTDKKTQAIKPTQRSPKTIATQSFSFTNIVENKVAQFKQWISGLVEHTNSTGMRLFFVFILGILMSLTPCIYPMIPVTVGILQTTASQSLARNFALALSYTIGIATTFAVLGLLAATGSTQFGQLMGNPWFIMFLVLFLGYLAFSMFGFYDMYTPRFMQGGDQKAVNGSFLSAFLFGAISGSVASPCLSPGLLLLLSIVATLGSTLLGFIYLFIFGLGLGFPLLIIGTFSNSMNIMPRAGFWMIEVKKLFGFMLLSMCFFYLSNILPWYLLLWMIGITLAASAFMYLFTIESYHSTGMRWFKYITGTVLLFSAFLLFFNAYKASVTTTESLESIHWKTNYEQAKEQGKQEQKLLLLDFGASWCSSCKEIEHKILHKQEVAQSLDNVLLTKIDCTNPSAEHCASVIDHFGVKGFPTIILIDPTTEKALAQWGGELIDLTPQEFINLVKDYTD